MQTSNAGTAFAGGAVNAAQNGNWAGGGGSGYFGGSSGIWTPGCHGAGAGGVSYTGGVASGTSSAGSHSPTLGQPGNASDPDRQGAGAGGLPINVSANPSAAEIASARGANGRVLLTWLAN